MELVEGLKTRRSIRNFLPKEVSEETIKEIVSIASYSPSWKNSQTVRYVAIFNKEIKEKIANEGIKVQMHNVDIIKQAPVLVVELTTPLRSGYERDGSFTNSKGTHWESFDAGINAQSFCLAAHSMGLGTLIMGIFDEESVKEIIGINNDLKISSLIAVGYYEKLPEAPKRKQVEELLIIK